jgi:hypothetical protein
MEAMTRRRFLQYGAGAGAVMALPWAALERPVRRVRDDLPWAACDPRCDLESIEVVEPRGGHLQTRCKRELSALARGSPHLQFSRALRAL